MAKRSAAPAAPDLLPLIQDPDALIPTADIVDLDPDGVAARRALFEVHAAAASRVATYQFKIPQGATAPALNAPDQPRDAHDQLHLVIALTGGAVARFPGGLVARVPIKVAGRFEALARPLIDDFLVAYDRSEIDRQDI